MFYTIGLWDAHQGTGNQDLQQTIGTTAETAAPLILVEMAKAVSERNEVECSFRLWQENISCQQHKSKTARNCEMLDWYVLLCQKRDEVP